MDICVSIKKMCFGSSLDNVLVSHSGKNAYRTLFFGDILLSNVQFRLVYVSFRSIIPNF